MKVVNKNIFFLFLLVVYFSMRFTIGVNDFVIYTFAIGMIVIRFSFEKIALFYFILGVITYMLSFSIEANHYISFVYASMILALFTHIFQKLKEFKYGE